MAWYVMVGDVKFSTPIYSWYYNNFYFFHDPLLFFLYLLYSLFYLFSFFASFISRLPSQHTQERVFILVFLNNKWGWKKLKSINQFTGHSFFLLPFPFCTFCFRFVIQQTGRQTQEVSKKISYNIRRCEIYI